MHPLSRRSEFAAASPINISSICVFGGEEPSKTFNNNEKYDVKANEWKLNSLCQLPVTRRSKIALEEM
jgi:hypothetical protein